MYELLYLFSDTHALVQFLDEDSTAIVPISRLKEQEHLEHGGSCIITWSDKKQYKALLLCSGLYTFNFCSEGVCSQSHYIVSPTT